MIPLVSKKLRYGSSKKKRDDLTILRRENIEGDAVVIGGSMRAFSTRTAPGPFAYFKRLIWESLWAQQSSWMES
jgi:hypothetical protein